MRVLILPARHTAARCTHMRPRCPHAPSLPCRRNRACQPTWLLPTHSARLRQRSACTDASLQGRAAAGIMRCSQHAMHEQQQQQQQRWQQQRRQAVAAWQLCWQADCLAATCGLGGGAAPAPSAAGRHAFACQGHGRRGETQGKVQVCAGAAVCMGGCSSEPRPRRWVSWRGAGLGVLLRAWGFQAGAHGAMAG